ncbi:TPA: hypothetical protein ACJJK2_002016, partial [Neisseria meningitidis]
FRRHRPPVLIWRHPPPRQKKTIRNASDRSGLFSGESAASEHTAHAHIDLPSLAHRVHRRPLRLKIKLPSVVGITTQKNELLDIPMFFICFYIVMRSDKRPPDICLDGIVLLNFYKYV